MSQAKTVEGTVLHVLRCEGIDMETTLSQEDCSLILEAAQQLEDLCPCMSIQVRVCVCALDNVLHSWECSKQLYFLVLLERDAWFCCLLPI